MGLSDHILSTRFADIHSHECPFNSISNAFAAVIVISFGSAPTFEAGGSTRLSHSSLVGTAGNPAF
jgi:hypothetical protein